MENHWKLNSHQLLSAIFKKQQPAETVEVQQAYGRLYFRNTRCTSCFSCMDVCPAAAIRINGTHISNRGYVCQWDMSRCVFCSLCVDNCPHGCLQHLSDVRLAVTDKNELLRELD